MWTIGKIKSIFNRNNAAIEMAIVLLYAHDSILEKDYFLNNYAEKIVTNKNKQKFGFRLSKKQMNKAKSRIYSYLPKVNYLMKRA